MTSFRILSLRSAIALAALSLGPSAAQLASPFAQEGVRPVDPPPQLPGIPGASDPKQEMIELFQKVETRLKEIDSLLYDAGAGDRRLSGSVESGIDELLKNTRSKSDDVLSGIDKILEIAKQQGGT